MARNVAIEYRWQGGQYATVQSHLADLLKLRPAVMTVGGIVAARAAQAATQSVPVLFTTAPDPVAMGLVASLNRPGGNLTGFSLAAPPSSLRSDWDYCTSFFPPSPNSRVPG